MQNTNDYEIWEHPDKMFKYQLLSRLIQDVEYYKNWGNRNKKHLWGLNEREHFETIELLYDSFDDSDKPEWLSPKQISKIKKDLQLN